ncbi:MAG: preprotein translocase subunit YajC [Dehalococcoidales bacterium]
MKRNGILKLLLVSGLLLSMIAMLGGCVPPQGEAEGFDWSILIFIGLIFGVFYFMMIRPQRRRQKEHNELMVELQKGDKVLTTGGIYGVVESLSDESIVIKIESGATLRVARTSVTGRREQK